MSKHIRTFGSFQGKRRNQEVDPVNETVIQRDDTFIVGGVKVEKKTINAYAKKVKDQTGKDLKSMYSEMEIAEELVKWSVNSLDNIDTVPVSALMGGEEEMAQDIELQDETELDETGDVSDEPDEDLDMSDETEGEETDMSDETEGEEDLDMGDEPGEDDFESPTDEPGEDTEGEEETDEEDTEDTEGEEEEDELPI